MVAASGIVIIGWADFAILFFFLLLLLKITILYLPALCLLLLVSAYCVLKFLSPTSDS